MFNAFICDIIYFLGHFNIANYADHSTTYNADKNIEYVDNNLKNSSIRHQFFFDLLNDNYMEVNTGRSHLLVSRNVTATAKIDNNYIESEKEHVLLDITIDSNLTFENHVNNACKRASQN